MVAPPSLKNIDSCEVSLNPWFHILSLKKKYPEVSEFLTVVQNWLPRRVMSAWRVAGIVHALEGIKEHECGSTMFDCGATWEAALKHGFQIFNH